MVRIEALDFTAVTQHLLQEKRAFPGNLQLVWGYFLFRDVYRRIVETSSVTAIYLGPPFLTARSSQHSIYCGLF